MKGLGEFLVERSTQSLVASQAGGLAVGLTAPAFGALSVLKGTLQQAEAEQVATSLQLCLTSPEFAGSVDRAVPPPHPEETEDEFVARAKKALEELLRAKIGK